MIYKAVLGEVKMDRAEELKAQAKRKVKAKQEEVEKAKEVAARLQKEYDELLEAEVIKDKPCGKAWIGNKVVGEITDWAIHTGDNDD